MKKTYIKCKRFHENAYKMVGVYFSFKSVPKGSESQSKWQEV